MNLAKYLERFQREQTKVFVSCGSERVYGGICSVSVDCISVCGVGLAEKKRAAEAGGAQNLQMNMYIIPLDAITCIEIEEREWKSLSFTTTE